MLGAEEIVLREMFRFSGTFYPRSNPELWLGSVRSRSKLALRIQEDFHSNVLQRKGDFEAQDGRVANDSNAVPRRKKAFECPIDPS